MSIFIYGSADDLIEVEGELYEEFYLPADDLAIVGLENGLIAKIANNNNWHARVIFAPEGVDWVIHPANSPAAKAIAENDYSDVLEVKTSAKWAVCGVDYVTRK